MAMRCCWPPESVGGPRVELVGEPDPVEQLGDILADALLGDAGDAQRQRDIVEGREVIDQAEILEHDADPAADRRQLAARQRGMSRAEQRDQAARRPLGEIHQLAAACSCRRRSARSGNGTSPAANRG